MKIKFQEKQEKKHEEKQMATEEGGETEEQANVSKIGGSSSQPFNIKNVFQSVMTKLSLIELEQAEFRQFVTNRFYNINEKQEAMYDEIQDIRAMQ